MNIIEFADMQDQAKSKEKNNPDFIKGFTEWAQSDERVWTFTSNKNEYHSYTAFIKESKSPFVNSRFELSYSGTDNGFVKVFTASKEGRRRSEYIDLCGDDAAEILQIIKLALLHSSGFFETSTTIKPPGSFESSVTQRLNPDMFKPEPVPVTVRPTWVVKIKGLPGNLSSSEAERICQILKANALPAFVDPALRWEITNMPNDITESEVEKITDAIKAKVKK